MKFSFQTAYQQSNNVTQLPQLSVVMVAFVVLFALHIAQTASAQTEKPLKDIKFLGLNLVDSKVRDVRDHLWDLGGFLQAKTTVKQHNIDKFFPWSTIRDSYYVTFQYNYAGEIVSVKRLFRPYADDYNNRRHAVRTIDIAKKMIPDLGKPTQIKRRGWGGSLFYRSYYWEDDTMSITIDREGGEALGNVFIEYIIKTHDRWAIELDTKDNKNI